MLQPGQISFIVVFVAHVFDAVSHGPNPLDPRLFRLRLDGAQGHLLTRTGNRVHIHAQTGAMSPAEPSPQLGR